MVFELKVFEITSIPVQRYCNSLPFLLHCESMIATVFLFSNSFSQTGKYLSESEMHECLPYICSLKIIMFCFIFKDFCYVY